MAITSRMRSWIHRGLTPQLVPDFSASLGRRISALRSGRGGNGRRSALGVTVAIGTVLAGAGTTALRGDAETAPPLDSPAGVAESAGGSDAGRDDFAYLGPVDIARVVVRPGKLAVRADFAPMVALVDAHLSAASREEANGVPAALSLASIDSIVCSLGTRSIAGSAEEVTTDVAIRFRNTADVDVLLEKISPQGTAMVDEGLSYIRFAEQPGDTAMMLAKRDEHTIALSDDVSRLREMVDWPTGTRSPRDAAASMLASVDGGVVAAVFNNGRSPVSWEIAETLRQVVGIGPPSAGEADPIEMTCRAIGEGSRVMGVGVDLGPGDGEVRVRAAFDCADAAAAERVRQGVDVFRQIATAMVNAIPESAFALDEAQSEEERSAIENSRVAYVPYRMLADATLDAKPRTDGRVEVMLEATGAVPASAFGFLSMTPDTATSDAAASAAP